MKILYEDRSILVVYKEQGITTQENKANEKCLLDIIREEYKDEKMYLALINRLDKDVSGLVLIAKSKEVAAKLNTMQQEREINKEYIAIVGGVPLNMNGRFDDLLFKDSSKNKSFVVDRMRKGVKDASLLYEVIKTFEFDGMMCSAIKVNLITGRTHQIRVQFSSRKMPILGDIKYGSTIKTCKIALTCAKIEFNHPITKKVVSVVSSLPAEAPWSMI